jgi:tight adherence protein B
MLEMLDPSMVMALGIGTVTALGFVLIAGIAGNPGGRRYHRRLVAVSAQKRNAREPLKGSSSSEQRSLSRRDSATPMMDRLIKNWLPRRDKLESRLARTGRQITIGQYVAAAGIVTLGVSGLVMTFTSLHTGPSALIGLMAGIGLPHLVIGRLGKRRIRAFLDLFPDAIDMLVRAIKSGLPISEAMVAAAHEIGDPVGSEFRSVESGMRMGRDIDSLLWDVAKRIDSPEWRFFITSLNVQREAGGNLAETLQNLGDLLRRRKSMRQKARAMSSEARASTMILGSLPIVVTLILFLTSPSYIKTLFTDVRGLMLVGIAVGMLVSGVAIMVRMAKFEI